MPDYDRDMGEIKTALAEMRIEVKSVWKRIDEQHLLTETVHELALSLRDNTGETKQLRRDYDAMQRDHEALQAEVNELKARPAKRWDSVVIAVITGVVGIGIGLLSRLIP